MPLLFAKGICRRYGNDAGSFYALRKCDVSFPNKGLFAIQGKSGSGKSTLLNLLAGIEKPSGGVVYYNGVNIQKRNHPFLGNEASIVFQHYNLVQGETALYNAALPALMRGQGTRRAKALLKQFGLTEMMHKDVALLSGGEKQRVALCRALVTDPSVLFADEPTGALDEENSHRVMKALRKISKTRLVIFVSHNAELIQQYADVVIEIIDGVLRRKSGSLETKSMAVSPRKRRFSSRWVFRFLGRNLKRNLGKNLMCFLAGVTGFSSLLLSFGYFVGNIPALEREQGKSLTYLTAAIARREEIQVPGSTLTLVKRTRPDPMELDILFQEFHHLDVVPDYGYFFPSAATFSVDGETYEPTTFTPVFDITLTEYGSSLIAEGQAPTGARFDECVVNLEFAEAYGQSFLGKTLSLHSRSVVTIGQNQQEIFVEAQLHVRAIVREFAFMNVPRVYYSYPLLAEELSRIEVPLEGEKTTNVAELVADSAPDSPYAHYGSLLFLHDPAEVASLYRLIEEDDAFEISSDCYAVRSSYEALSSAFVSSLLLFVGIALVGLVLILGMAAVSSFVARKKENAILICLGALGRDIRKIYVLEAVVLCLCSAGFALLLSPLLQRFLNYFLQTEFDVSNLIDIPFATYFGMAGFVIWALLLFAMALGILSSSVPMWVYRHFTLVEELRDE